MFFSSVVGGKKGVCSHSSEEKPPKISFKLENAGDVPYFTKTWSDDDLPIDILLLAVESCDFLSCFSLQDQLLKIDKSELGYVYFGNMGDASDQEKVKVALVNCSKEAATAGCSLTVESRDFLSCFSLQDQLLKIYKSEFGYIMCTLETWEMPRTKKR